MSSGACRALVAVLLMLIVAPVLAVPVAANSERLREVAQTVYTVDPAARTLKVNTIIGLENKETTPYNRVPWGPIIVENAANLRGLDDVRRRNVPGPWTAIEVGTPAIGPGDTRRITVTYTLDADGDAPIRIDDGYLYFCVIGQDTDAGTVEVRIRGRDRFALTQSGTPLEITQRGLRSTDNRDPGDIFTCIEGTVDENLQTATLIGPGGREIVLQASPSGLNWLGAAQSRVGPALDRIADFLGQDIPGQGAVIVRESPSRDYGGYASAHDTLGVVQVDDAAGTREPQVWHELAHAWFGADNVTEPWLREGLAEWVATSMLGAECPALTSNEGELDLSDWQVVRPTASDDIDQLVVDQAAAACGIVSATRARMGDQEWQAVLAALLEGQSKYPGSGGATVAAGVGADYREWLDTVDEVGLVPAAQRDPAFAANLDELDWAQDLLAAFQIPTDPAALEQRSQARAAYHEFLATSDGLGAPLVVRQALDDWEFNAAMSSLEKSTEVLASLREADALLPDADLIPVIAPLFESAASEGELDDVLVQSQELMSMASQVFEPLSDLRAALPEGWSFPAAVQNAIVEKRFEDIEAAIPPALEVVSGINAANEVLPEAALPDKFRERFESIATPTSLQELADEVADELAQAREAGTSLRSLESAVETVGGWRIPAAVRQPIDAGRVGEAIPVLADALAVISATTAGDAALPDADLAAEFRPRFEAAASAAELATLRADAATKADQAEAVGRARIALQQRAADWHLPPIVQQPIDQRDFETAARVARVAEQWIVAAADADAKLPEIGALDKARPLFEGAATMADLEAGAQLAEDWNNAAVSVRDALDASQRPLDLLGSLGMWGTDVSPLVQQAKDAAIDGKVEEAVNAAAAVNATFRNASSVGGLRLAGLIFFVVAIVGVAGLWFLLRREAGPPWARQRKPHWLKDQNDPKGGGKGGDRNDSGPPRAIDSGNPQRRGR